jgi:hypothetical protein
MEDSNVGETNTSVGLNNELNEFKRGICGCSVNKTDEVKLEIGMNGNKQEYIASDESKADEKIDGVDSNSNQENSSLNKINNNEMVEKLSHDLSSPEVSIDLIEIVCNLIAELAKNGENYE